MIAVLIKLDSRGPVFFRQIRVGRDGKEFRMWKFRTMVAGADERKAELAALNEADGLFKIADDPRITTRRQRPAARTRSTSCRSSSTCCAAR